jgi:hypothetical protein
MIKDKTNIEIESGHERMEFGPRPFYAIGHNTNTIKLVKEALDAGANAIEPDVNIYRQDPAEVCISHYEGDAEAPTLKQFLTSLRETALLDSRLSLIVFDCKSTVATPEFGLELLTAIRNCLTFDTGLNIVISVSGLENISLFDKIKDILGPREGLMIDENNDPELISHYFRDAGVINQCYGNGISIPGISIMGPNVMPSIEKACALRAATAMPKFNCVWTVNEERLKREFILSGVDGIITDDLKDLRKQMYEPEFQRLIRYANRMDNPFKPLNNAYCLTIFTADRPMAGTDANITFTLTGTNGFSKITVDTSLRSRMERGHCNFLTLQSPNLGELLSVTVQRDHSGNAPDWWLDKIVVESTCYSVAKTAVFKREINSIHPFIQTFNAGSNKH